MEALRADTAVLLIGVVPAEFVWIGRESNLQAWRGSIILPFTERKPAQPTALAAQTCQRGRLVVSAIFEKWLKGASSLLFLLGEIERRFDPGGLDADFARAHPVAHETLFAPIRELIRRLGGICGCSRPRQQGFFKNTIGLI
jgi:hypothetical protein